jgi:hypothetical protein
VIKRKVRVVAQTLLAGSICLVTLYAVSAPRRASGYLSQAADYGRQLLLPPADAHVESSALEDAGDVTQDVQEQDLDKLSYLPLALKEYCGEYRRGHRRFGFGAPGNPVDQYVVSLLRAGWYHTFWFRENPTIPAGMEYAQTIRLCDPATPPYQCDSAYVPSQQAIEDYAAAHPGILWIIGNEPDAPLQDCITPHRYAELYHELYGIIKSADPTAQVAIAGVVQGTPLRLRYLDMILEEYDTLYGGMIPVDVWNVHGFVLREKRYWPDNWGCQIPCGIYDVDVGMLYEIDDHDNLIIFKQHIVAFRQWMKDHGQRNKPLVVTEYGVLFPDYLGYDEERVRDFMLASFDYFYGTTDESLGYPRDCNRLVQAWAWYSLDDEYFEEHNSFSHLFDPDTKQITNLGTAYGNYTAPLP